MVGRAMAAGEFSFQLFEGDQLIETVTHHSDGTFSFSPLTFTKAGEYVYTIREVVGDVPGVSYTGAEQPITVTITVTDIGGALVATVDISNTQIHFENLYHAAQAEVSFLGTKTLVGGEVSDYPFSFQLYLTDHNFDIANGTLLDTVAQNNGAFAFDPIVYTEAGTYFYVVVEDASDALENIVYDGTQHRFRVQVSDVGDGQLRVVVEYLNTGYTTQSAASAEISVGFTNATFEEVTEKEVYMDGEVTTEIDGMQVAAGDILTYFISYTNYNGKDVLVDILDAIPAHTAYVEGSASHNGIFLGDLIHWALNVAPGETVTFEIKLTMIDGDAHWEAAKK